MTRNRADEAGTPTDIMIEYYRQRSSAGLIITEASQVSAQGVGYIKTPGIHTREQVEAWKPIVEAVHDQDCVIFLQLFHSGRISHPLLQEDGHRPVAPSPIKPDGKAYTFEGPKQMVTPRELGTEEIPDIVAQFQRGAANAMEAGFDGVEIHGANGYIIDQFLRDKTNHRNDYYGGNIENRCRLLTQITEAVVKEISGPRVGIHLSPMSRFNDIDDSDPVELFSHAIQSLNQFKPVYLHMVELDGLAPDTVSDTLTSIVRGLAAGFEGAYIANGAFDRDRANQAIESGELELVSFGRPFIANPDLPERFGASLPLEAPDPDYFYTGEEKGYIDYSKMS
jgi:N-ethylmaleimide reductase